MKQRKIYYAIFSKMQKFMNKHGNDLFEKETESDRED